MGGGSRVNGFTAGESVAWRLCRASMTAFVIGVVVALAVCVPARAYVYWTASSGTLGRANLDGSGVNQSFIGGVNGPGGVAVDGSHLYWAQANEIRRANLDGSGAGQPFIGGASTPIGVAVDSAHVYWINNGFGTLGRANLDGSAVDNNFIVGLSYPYGVAVDSAHIYWANYGTQEIRRANLNGSGAAQPFISGVGQPIGVAVDAAHVYWVDRFGRIGRANLDGSGVQYDFISGLNAPNLIAVDGGHIYWTNVFTDEIWRANLDGSGASQLTTGAMKPVGVAVDSLPSSGRRPGAGPTTGQGPAFTSASLSNRSFAVGRAATPLTGAAAAAHGTTVLYGLSEVATVHLGVQRAARGRRSGTRCVKPRRSNRHARPCKRWLDVGGLTRSSKAGPNRVAFTGRLGRRPLGRGGYRFALDARDAQRRRSAVRYLPFRIVRR